MEEASDRVPRALTLLRVALALFVVAWIFGPYALRASVPVWLVFLIAAALEVGFFAEAVRPGSGSRPDRGPQTVDRERFGYPDEPDELLLVHDRGEELWLPYSGETAEEVDELVADARDEPAETPEVEPEREPEPVRERRRAPLALRRLITGLAVIGGLGLVVWVVERNTGWDSLSPGTRIRAAERFSAEASRIAGKPVEIRCDESGRRVGAVQHADGVAVVGGDLAYLTPERCLDLYRLSFRDQVRGAATGRALAVLAHEAWHLRGVRNEGETECYAFQSGVALGQRLGLSEGRARQLMRQQLAENTLRGGATVEYRVPPECRDAGRLDLDPTSSAFP